MDLSDRYPQNNIDANWIKNISQVNGQAALLRHATYSLPVGVADRVRDFDVNNTDVKPPKNEDLCQQWITAQQAHLENADFGECRSEVETALKEQRKKSTEVELYRVKLNNVTSRIKDPKVKEGLNGSYINLVDTAKQRLTCLENNAQIVQIDQLYGPLCHKIHSTAVNLVTLDNHDTAALVKTEQSTNVGYNSQRCILATRSAWGYLIEQLHCVEQQLKHAAEYHKFFYDVQEYRQWMIQDVRQVENVIKLVNDCKNGQKGDPHTLIARMNVALAAYQNWRSRIDSTYDRSKRVLPIHLRTSRLDHERHATALSSYRTSELNVSEGEELIVLDNSESDRWKIRNLRGDISYVPSVLVMINGPDLRAIDEALKLQFLFFNSWIDSVRRLGKVLIHYLSSFFRNWNTEEKNKLSSLKKISKEELLSMIASIPRVFSPYWDVYKPYKTLQTKAEILKDILTSATSAEYIEDGTPIPDLVGHAKPLKGMMDLYKSFWDEWEQFRCLSDARHRPENLLSQNDWEKYKLLSSAECLEKWLINLMKDDDDLDLVDGSDMVIEDEIYMMKTAKELAETSQLSTSEIEERQTFIITGVIDPRNGEEISMDRAVRIGIINQRDGKYVNPKTRESIPIPVAMSAGKIKVEFITTNKSKEKRSDLALITIKTFSESRPFTVRGIVDAKTEKTLTIEEAIKFGILDQKRSVYVNRLTGQDMSMADALDSGLLVVEFDQQNEHMVENRAEDVVIKTYAIHAVIEPSTSRRLSFLEAVQVGLMDAETGAYNDKNTGEIISVGDAIKRGLLKASIVTDPKSYDIASGKKLNLVNSFEQKLRSNVGQSILAVSAFQESGKTAHRQPDGVDCFIED